jgi:hypothetical protein
MRELWEFVLSFEDGSLPAPAWNERTIAVVAVWYLSMHPVKDAVARLESAIARHRRRFQRRAEGASSALVDFTSLWPSVEVDRPSREPLGESGARSHSTSELGR